MRFCGELGVAARMSMRIYDKLGVAAMMSMIFCGELGVAARSGRRAHQGARTCHKSDSCEKLSSQALCVCARRPRGKISREPAPFLVN